MLFKKKIKLGKHFWKIGKNWFTKSLYPLAHSFLINSLDPEIFQLSWVRISEISPRPVSSAKFTGLRLAKPVSYPWLALKITSVLLRKYVNTRVGLVGSKLGSLERFSMLVWYGIVDGCSFRGRYPTTMNWNVFKTKKKTSWKVEHIWNKKSSADLRKSWVIILLWAQFEFSHLEFCPF